MKAIPGMTEVDLQRFTFIVMRTAKKLASDLLPERREAAGRQRA